MQHEPQERLLGQRPMESFFHTLKTEMARHRDYKTRGEAKADIFECFDVFYNRNRRHSALGSSPRRNMR
jgi:transposase InsO family protein